MLDLLMHQRDFRWLRTAQLISMSLSIMLLAYPSTANPLAMIAASALIEGSVLIGLCNALLSIGLSTTVQRLVPDEMRGRVMSTVNALPTAAMLAASAVAGALAGTVGVRWVVGSSALLLALASLVA